MQIILEKLFKSCKLHYFLFFLLKIWHENHKETITLQKNMAISSEKLKKILQDAFPDADFQLDDMLGDADHYGLTITSKAFEGLGRIKRHQAIYKALGDLMGNELHALSIRAYTSQELKTKEN